MHKLIPRSSFELFLVTPLGPGLRNTVLLPLSALADPQAVTLDVLQSLLGQQTRELRDAQKLELARSLGKVQLELRKEFDTVRADDSRISGVVDAQSGRLEKVEDACA